MEAPPLCCSYDDSGRLDDPVVGRRSPRTPATPIVIPSGRQHALPSTTRREGSHADEHRSMRPLRGANIGSADVLWSPGLPRDDRWEWGSLGMTGGALPRDDRGRQL